MAATESAVSDLWWVDPDEGSLPGYLYLAHHSPGDVAGQPARQQWYYSLTTKGDLAPERKRYRPDFTAEWRQRCQNSNIYRSLQLFSSERGDEAALGPFLLDISHPAGDNEGLNDAWDVTRKALTLLRRVWLLPEQSLRLFFTVRRGFNLEVRPAVLGIGGPYARQLESSWHTLRQLTGSLKGETGGPANQVTSRGTVVAEAYGGADGPALQQPLIRLHGSENVWRTQRGVKRQRKIEVPVAEAEKQTVGAILAQAEAG